VFDCANTAVESKNEKKIAAIKERTSPSDRKFCFYLKTRTVYLSFSRYQSLVEPKALINRP
jgi:hypothetical protein